jgi:uncharacterized membrane protein
MAEGRLRRGYLDWLRGLAVLIMIEAHVLDSWTRFPDRETRAYAWSMILGGMGAPLFLFLAGLSVAMSAGSKARRTGDPATASRSVVRRGLEIFGLAFLFRLQAWILGWSSPKLLLKVDILNIMGPSIMMAATLWRFASSVRGRVVVFALATAAVAFFTPALRGAPFFAALPDPIEAYFRPVGGLSNFVFLPWAAFVFAGAIPGVLIDASRTAEEEARHARWFCLAGALIAVAAFALSYLPSPFSNAYFWTTSPAFFFLRVGIMTATIWMAYLWESRPGGAITWSPMRQLGRTSLFIYWIHVEMVYGLISLPLHKRLSFGQSLLGLVMFSLFMLICSIAKDRVVEWWRGRKDKRATSRENSSV